MTEVAPESTLQYKRVLIKLSGEALLGQANYGIDPEMIKRIAKEIRQLVDQHVQVALVIGGGNIFRGEGLAASGMDRVTGDHMGMLATVINALAMQEALEGEKLPARVMSALQINDVCEDYIRRRAIRHLEKGRVTIFAAGTGNPFFTTDSAASLRAVEIDADILLKATKVDGVYTADPKKDATATKFDKVSFDYAISNKLAVMDTTAMALCRDNDLDIRVFDLNEPGNLMKIMQGDEIGTLVTNNV